MNHRPVTAKRSSNNGGWGGGVCRGEKEVGGAEREARKL